MSAITETPRILAAAKLVAGHGLPTERKFVEMIAGLVDTDETRMAAHHACAEELRRKVWAQYNAGK